MEAFENSTLPFLFFFAYEKERTNAFLMFYRLDSRLHGNDKVIFYKTVIAETLSPGCGRITRTP